MIRKKNTHAVDSHFVHNRCAATLSQIVAIVKSIAALLQFCTMLDFGGVDLRVGRLIEAWAYFTFYGKYWWCDEGGGKRRKILQETQATGAARP